MSFFDYTGDQTAAESPSPAPGSGLDPILHIPDGNEAFDIANLLQPLKTLADFASYNRRRLLRACDFTIDDEFVGSAISTENWATTTNCSLVGAVAGANGVIRANGTASDATLATCTLNKFGTRDFYFGAVANLLSTPATTGQVTLGNIVTPQYAWAFNPNIVFTGASTHWVVIVGGLTVFASSVLADTNFHAFEIFRVNGTVYFLLDGALVYSAASAINCDGEKFGVTAAKLSGSTDCQVDRGAARIVLG